MHREYHKNNLGNPALFPLYVRVILSIYSGALSITTPILKRLFGYWGKKDPHWLELMGHHTTPRPSGQVIWIHGASLGELRSGLILMQHLKEYDPEATLLVTVCNTRSLYAIQPHIPKGSFSFLFPLDCPIFVKCFLDHWKPNAVCFLECELWPNILLNLHGRGIPFFNINFITPGKSAYLYKMLGDFLPSLLSLSSGVWMSTVDKTYTWGVKKGVIKPELMPSLKYGFKAFSKKETSAGPDLKKPFWIVSCTKKEETSLILTTHKELRKKHPDLILIWALRSPPRNSFINALNHSGFCYTFRSKDKDITPSCQIYLIDTLGELDFFYSQAPFVVMGNSFTKKGLGHNVLEPIAQGSLPIVGPYTPACQHLVSDFLPVNAIMQIPSGDLLQVVSNFLNNPEQARSMAKNGHEKLAEKKAALGEFLDHLMPIVIQSSAPTASSQS